MKIQDLDGPAVEDVIRATRMRALAVSGEARLLRERAGLTTIEMARALGTSTSNLSRWELGENKPKIMFAARWHRLLCAITGEDNL